MGKWSSSRFLGLFSCYAFSYPEVSLHRTCPSGHSHCRKSWILWSAQEFRFFPQRSWGAIPAFRCFRSRLSNKLGSNCSQEWSCLHLVGPSLTRLRWWDWKFLCGSDSSCASSYSKVKETVRSQGGRQFRNLGSSSVPQECSSASFPPRPSPRSLLNFGRTPQTFTWGH